MPIVGISLTQADRQLFLRGEPSQGRGPIEPSHLRALVQECGFAEWVINEAALASAVQDCNLKTTPFAIPIGALVDACIKVLVAADDMSAAVSLTPPQDGNPITVEDVLQALQDAGVTFGVDLAALEQACIGGIVQGFPVATGEAPQDGIDTDFQEIIADSSDRAPRLNAEGLIDYREHGAIALVEPGAPLMRRIPPTPGIDGRSIRGQIVSPRPGRDEPFAAALPGSEIDGADPNVLRASIAGLPVRVPHGVIVEPVLRVAEVNLATGNLYFDGTVHVDGDVNNTMKVQASGDIVVHGTVEGAVLEAGGNITIKGGVIAQAVVTAKGAISARFVEGSTLNAGTVIALDDMALESTLVSGNQILIGIKSPQRGRLVGGSTRTMMLLRVPLLGSNRATATQVYVGCNPELEAVYQALQERIATEKANEDNLQKLVHHLTAIKDPKGMLDKVKIAWRQAAQTWGRSLGERTDLDAQLAQTRNAKLEIGVGTDGLVELAFGSKKLRLRKQYSRGTLSLDTHTQIVFTDPSGHATPAS